MHPTLIDVEEAQRILLRLIEPLDVVELPLSEALGHTLAVAIRSDIDDPPFDRSVMDGFAVRSADVAAAPVTLRIAGQIPAGHVADRVLASGEAMQINTGAPIPPGTDAVVRVEDCDVDHASKSVTIKTTAGTGQFISRRGGHIQAGNVVLEAGTTLTPLAIGAAAAAGAARVRVYRRPTVAMLTTGDELVEIDRKPTGAEIRNSNRYQLEAWVRSTSVELLSLGSVGDDREALRDRIRAGFSADVLCITGGVSMGDFDHVPAVLQALGAVVHFQKLAIKPGRPVLCASAPPGEGRPRGTMIFALPGNPISAAVGFVLLVKPALAAMQGRGRLAKLRGTSEADSLSEFSVPPRIAATLSGRLSATARRRTFVPGRTEIDAQGRCVVMPLRWHGSGDALGAGPANALIDRRPESPPAESGETVRIIPLFGEP